MKNKEKKRQKTTGIVATKLIRAQFFGALAGARKQGNASDKDKTLPTLQLTTMTE